jgi:hypothetical protein
MQTVSAHVNEDARRSELPSTSSGSNCLIESAGACERNQNGQERHVLIVDPGDNRRNLKRIASYASGATGNSMKNVVPSPNVDSTRM